MNKLCAKMLPSLRRSIVISFCLGLVFSVAPFANAQESLVIPAKDSSADISKIKRAKPMPSAAPKPQMPGGSGNFNAGCCSPPIPFPGLACCDTRDCGWFSCDAVISNDKKFKR